MRGNEPKHSYDLSKFDLLSKLKNKKAEKKFLHTRNFFIFNSYLNSYENPQV